LYPFEALKKYCAHLCRVLTPERNARAPSAGPSPQASKIKNCLPWRRHGLLPRPFHGKIGVFWFQTVRSGLRALEPVRPTALFPKWTKAPPIFDFYFKLAKRIKKEYNNFLHYTGSSSFHQESLPSRILKQELFGEKGISTEQHSAEKNARVQGAHVHQRRTSGFEAKAGQGPQTADR
jgi:hypothetical protein